MQWPFLKFYTRDWQSDFELRMCSLEARGFWIECLCIMHNAKRRGFMETPKGDPLTDEQTSRLIGTFKGDVIRCKEELALHGVFSTEEDTGIIYCRRMVKDTKKAEKCSNAGAKGGGNPSFSKKEPRTQTLDTRNQIPDTRNHISLKVTFKGDDLALVENFSEERHKAFEDWLGYKRERRQGYKLRGLKTLIKQTSDLSDSELQNLIDTSISNSWSGFLFTDKAPKKFPKELETRLESLKADAKEPRWIIAIEKWVRYRVEQGDQWGSVQLESYITCVKNNYNKAGINTFEGNIEKSISACDKSMGWRYDR